MLLPALRDLLALENAVNGYIADVEAGGYVNEDHHQWIFEAAMTYFYGPAVWAYLRQFGS